jgi:4-hydroxy-tetrahydrodipicolinate reductase
MSKSVLIYGFGKLGESILKGLIDLGIKVYHESYNGLSDTEKVFDYKNVLVDINNSTKLKKQLYRTDLKYEVSYIIVTLTGDVLEKEIDFLLELEIPLIILSTKYDEELISSKAENAGVQILMSQNMALAIVDFWNRIDSIDNVPVTEEISIFVQESHQKTKADISGSAIKALNLFESKDFLIYFDDKDKESFKPGVDAEYGCISCIRNEKTQLEKLNVPKEFLGGHGYHTICLFPEIWNNESVMYLSKLYNIFKSLEDYTIEGVLDFKVFIEQDEGLVIVHNINGRDIYTDGVVKSMKFLENVDVGVYSAIDVINSIVSE